MRKIIFIFLVMALSSCSSGSDSSSAGGKGVNLSGVVASGYTLTAKSGISDYIMGKAFALSRSRQVDQIVGIPFNNNTREPYPEGMVMAPVDASGNFSFSLTSDYDWLILLTDSKARLPEDKVAAYVSMSSIQGDAIVSMPVSSATSNQIDLGQLNLNAASQEAQSSNTTTTLQYDFALTLQQLQLRAKYDNSFKTLINSYLNYNNGKGFGSHVEFDWDGGSLPAALANTEANPLNYAYDGYRLYFNPPAGLLAYNSICNVPDALVVVPPTSVNMVNQYAGTGQPPALQSVITPTAPFNSSASMTNQGGTYCFDNANEIGISVDAYGTQVNVPVGSLISGNPPAGWWRMKYQGQQIGIFDFETASPVDASGNPLVFLPAPTLVVDTSGAISRIDVQWYAYDAATGTYTLLNPSDIENLVSYSFIELNDNTNLNDIFPNDTGLVTSMTTFKYNWTTNNSTSPNHKLDRLSVGYTLGNVGYRVSWEPNR